MNTPRIVQVGQGSTRPLVAVYFLGRENDARIRDACGPAPAIVNITKGAPWEVHAGLMRLSHVVDWTRQRVSARISRTVGAGWSQGCKGWRSQLAAGEEPDALVLADGIHGSLVGTEPYQGHVDTWRTFVEQAKRGDKVFFASDCGHKYVETLQRGAYASVATMLRAITGWQLPDASARGRSAADPERHQEGLAVVYRSGEGLSGPNGEAHVAHAQHVLPRMLREALQALRDVDTEPAPPPDTPLRLRALQWCMQEHARFRDEPAPIARIDEYMRGCERNGALLGLSSGKRWNYCAGSQGFAEHEAALADEELPPWRAAAKEIMRDAQEGRRGRWHPVTDVTEGSWLPPMGALAVYHRGKPGAWTGHVDRVVEVQGDGYVNVGGNELGGRWNVEHSSFVNPALLGFVVDDEEWQPTADEVPDVPDDAVEPDLTETDRRQVRGLVALTIDGQVRNIREDGYR